MDLGSPAAEIAYLVVPTAPGRVRIEGANVTYIDRARPGNKHAYDGFVLNVKPPNS